MSGDSSGMDNEGTDVVRLFPLPDLVMFPNVVQPLHIFEPRYRQMTADALEDDRRIAVVLLMPGWEETYDQRPAVHPVGCLGRIFNEEQLGDGRWNLLLHGTTRVRLVEERTSDRLYRTFDVRPLEDAFYGTPTEEKAFRAEMEKVMPPLLQSYGGQAEQARKLLDGNLTLSQLCDIFSFALPLEPAFKQELLEELDVGRRVARLLRQLSGTVSPRRFPPDFSFN